MLRNPPPNPYEYNHTYTDSVTGKKYVWDPDFHCWMETLSDEEYAAMSHWDKHGWLWVTLALMIGSLFFI